LSQKSDRRSNTPVSLAIDGKRNYNSAKSWPGCFL